MVGKDEEFWRDLERWDVMVLVETWVEEKGWEWVEGKLPRGYEWKKQWATRENKKGRAKGGMLLGIRKELVKKEEKGMEEGEMEGVITGKIRIDEEEWRVIGVYVNQDLRRKMRGLRYWWDKGAEERVIIGGDFNARTGEEGGGVEIEGEGEGGGRKSRDKKVNGDGRKLLEELGEMGLEILNGGIVGDEEGEYTYMGQRGRTVIDYIVGDERTKDGIERMEVEERVESDHMPIVVTMESRGGRETDRERERKGKKRSKIDWNEEVREEFRRRTEEMGVEGEGVRERLELVGKKVKEIIEEVKEREGKKGREIRGWWDRECREKKKDLRRVLRKWKKRREGGEEYREKRNEYKKLCEEKKTQERDRIIREAGEANTEGKVWNFLRKVRRKGKRIEEGIKKEEWKEYFMGVLGGVENRVVGGEIRGGRSQRGGEIGMEEVERAIKRLKTGKAAGEDGMVNEVWMYGGRDLKKEIWEICNKVWKGEGWPEEWKVGVVVPIKKKGDGKTVECYRGVTLLNTMYKVYAMILEERLEKEMEEKEMVPESQTGFRKGRGTMDNVYVLNYLINRELARKRGRIVGCFVDMKAAFDSVNRGKLWEALKERGVSESLRERIREVYRETVVRVKIGEEMGERFWVGRGVRQGCPLSAKLFILFMADLEEKMRVRGKGGVEIRGKKVYTLQYADDLVLLAKDEGGMGLMIEELKRYVKEKGLEVNREKTKIVRFGRKIGEGRVWRWGEGVIEEVREIKYLGYVFRRNGGQEGQIGDRVRRAGGVMRSVWGIGKRYFNEMYGRREWLFDALVWPVMGYGAEVWGWGERKKVESMQERYLRWILGVEWVTPGYMIREETKREKLRLRGARRAWKFEERLREGKGSRWARECLKEIEARGREGKKLSGWEEERKRFIEERGSRREIEGREKEEREEEWRRIERREGEMQKEENRRKVIDSRYNKWYKEVRVEKVPEYLKKGWKEEKWSRVARFRLGNGMREGRYWEKEEDRRCRKCGGEVETWEHVLERCREEEGRDEGMQEKIRRILAEDGRGERWMAELDKERKVEGIG